MKGVIVMNKERLTWNEICKRYPNQQVGLEDVEWDSYDDVVSAVVVYTENDHTRAEINGIAACSDGKIQSENTTPYSILTVGLAV